MNQVLVDSGIQSDKLREYILAFYPDRQEQLKDCNIFLVLREVSSPTNCVFLQSLADHFNLPLVHQLINEYIKEEDLYKTKLLDKDFIKELEDESKNFRADSEIVGGTDLM